MDHAFNLFFSSSVIKILSFTIMFNDFQAPFYCHCLRQYSLFKRIIIHFTVTCHLSVNYKFIHYAKNSDDKGDSDFHQDYLRVGVEYRLQGWFVQQVNLNKGLSEYCCLQGLPSLKRLSENLLFCNEAESGWHNLRGVLTS